ncbi:MAG: SIR2 family protein [Bernardetiaceae bacterium]
MPVKPPDQVNWDFIVETIRTERCVLMLGPEVARNAEGLSLYQSLLESLDLSNQAKVRYYNDDEFFFFRDPLAKTRAVFDIQQFYARHSPSPLFEQILQIPFHLCISVSPDLMLRQSFEQYNLPHRFDYYRKYENPQAIERPTQDYPLIYNLFGAIEDDESLIFTHEDLFEFLFAILGDRKLPRGLESQLQSAKNFIFLGFKFDKWYVKLLLRLLSLHTGNFLRYASYSQDSVETLNFCMDHFRIDFIDLSMDDFVQTLYDRCQERGMLRPLSTSDTVQTPWEIIQGYIRKDEVKAALLKIESYLAPLPQEEELLTTLTLLMSRYNRLQRKITNGVIDEDESERQLNRIKQDVLSLGEALQEILEEQQL